MSGFNSNIITPWNQHTYWVFATTETREAYFSLSILGTQHHQPNHLRYKGSLQIGQSTPPPRMSAGCMPTISLCTYWKLARRALQIITTKPTYNQISTLQGTCSIPLAQTEGMGTLLQEGTIWSKCSVLPRKYLKCTTNENYSVSPTTSMYLSQGRNAAKTTQYRQQPVCICHRGGMLQKLLSIANNRIDHYVSVKFQGRNATKMSKEHIKEVSDDPVQSTRDPDQRYLVDAAIGVCSPVKHACSHQHAVYLRNVWERFHQQYSNTATHTQKRTSNNCHWWESCKRFKLYASVTQASDESTYTPFDLSDGSGPPDFSGSCWATMREGAKEERPVQEEDMETCGNGTSLD